MSAGAVNLAFPSPPALSRYWICHLPSRVIELLAYHTFVLSHTDTCFIGEIHLLSKAHLLYFFLIRIISDKCKFCDTSGISLPDTYVVNSRLISLYYSLTIEEGGRGCSINAASEITGWKWRAGFSLPQILHYCQKDSNSGETLSPILSKRKTLCGCRLCGLWEAKVAFIRSLSCSSKAVSLTQKKTVEKICSRPIDEGK